VNPGGIVLPVVVGLAVLAVLYAVVWSLFDVVFRAPDLTLLARVLWVLALITLSFWAAIAYVRFGPGVARWHPLHRWTGVQA
jgi:hypothetical protein